jgi:hypothetical protein
VAVGAFAYIVYMNLQLGDLQTQRTPASLTHEVTQTPGSDVVLLPPTRPTMPRPSPLLPLGANHRSSLFYSPVLLPVQSGPSLSSAND